MNDRLQPLAEPVGLGSVRLANRVFVAPHTTNFAPAGVNEVTEQHLAYHRQRAAGGAGLVITEGIRVHPTSLRRLGLQAFNDSSVHGLSELTDVVHGEGARIFAQLLHTGRHTGDERSGAWAPSATPWATGAPVPHPMNARDIRVLTGSYAAAAGRVLRAGFDGIELHIGHGHLLQQFLSPATNHRTDEYGGSAANRLRLAREVLDAVRSGMDGTAPLGLRLSADEFLPGGLGVEEMLEIVASLNEQVPLDFLHVSHSAYASAPTLDTQMADMSYPSAPYTHLPARFKQAFGEIPILAICRLDDLETGARVIADGAADLVGFARPHIADPHMVRKELGHDPVNVRHCIACNQGCNSNLEKALPIRCTVNPEVGMEAVWASVREAPAEAGRVVVVGAGPAGMEAAATAARRGHEVELWEASEVLGGTVNVVSGLRGRERFGVLASDLERDLEAAGVAVRLSREATVDGLMASGAGAVVIATGAADRPPRELEGASFGRYSTREALEQAADLGDHVVVLDESCSWDGAGLAEHIAVTGARVELVTPVAGVAGEITVYSRLALFERLGAEGVKVRPLRLPVGAVDGDGVVIRDTINGDEEVLPEVTALVDVRPGDPRDELLEGLAERGFGGEAYLIGDAHAPRACQDAVYEGRVAGIGIGARKEDTVEPLLPGRSHVLAA